MFKKLSHILGTRAGKKNNLGKQLEIVKVFDLYRLMQKRFLPSAPLAAPQVLKHRVLTVKVESPVQANELRLLEERIIGGINKVLGREMVNRIVYRL